MTEPDYAHDVFLCHNRADKEWVRRFAEQLGSETIDVSPTGRRLRVFFDEWDIDVGVNIVLPLGEALRDSRFVAVLGHLFRTAADPE